jgi:hypothetical protein
MFCPVTRKVSYDTEELAVEALIQNHIRNDHMPGRGPINVYQCEHCGTWHFTSKGLANPTLENEDVKARIKKEKLGEYWDRKLR